MIIIANGYKLPETDDDGSVFFPAMEFNISRIAGHTHDGANSSVLPAKIQTIAAASWTATAGQTGTYQQDITMTTPLVYDTTCIGFRLSDGSWIYPTIAKLTANSFRVFTNDNTQTYTAVYSS